MVLIKHKIFNKNLIKLNRNQKILKVKKTNKKKRPNQRKRLANNKYQMIFLNVLINILEFQTSKDKKTIMKFKIPNLFTKDQTKQ